MEADVDAIINALIEQRNAAMNEIARMAGIIATLKKEMKNESSNPTQPELDGLHSGGSTSGAT